jgi:hypothetical protein
MTDETLAQIEATIPHNSILICAWIIFLDMMMMMMMMMIMVYLKYKE